MVNQVEEGFRIYTNQDQKVITLKYIIVKTLDIQNKERKLKSARETCHVAYKGKSIRATDF
jgi:hypothetical protein